MIKRLRHVFHWGMFLILMASPAMASPLGDAVDILEANTSFHWGRDCLVWFVHYPESLVDPWVEADALGKGYSPEQKEAYRRSFREQLRIGEAESFLMTVYNFGPQPINLGAISDSVALVTDDGQRFSPTSYEEKLNQPISGVVQGLVFFPKRDGPFSLVVKGLGIWPEQVFAFSGASFGVSGGERDPGETVPRIVEPPVVDPPELPKESAQGDSQPQSQPLPYVPNEPPVETEPPAWLGPGPLLVPQKPQVDPIPAVEPRSVDLSAELKNEVSGDISADRLEQDGPSRERVVERFLSLWAQGKTGAMFDMLASSAQSEGREAFSKRANSSPLRWSLADGYKLRWLDASQVRVSVAQKLILIKVSQSEVLRVVSEKGHLAVVW